MFTVMWWWDPHLASSLGTRDDPSAFWSGVLVVIERKTDFTLSCESRQDQACLIECEFGEFGSKNQTSAPAPSLAALTPVSVELKRLSTTTMILPGFPPTLPEVARKIALRGLRGVGLRGCVGRKIGSSGSEDGAGARVAALPKFAGSLR